MFAALLIWIDHIRVDYVLKENAPAQLKPPQDYESQMEYLKIVHHGYFWKMQLSVYGFFGIAVAFCWSAAQHAFGHPEVFPKVSWGMIFAAYGSIGILLIANQYLKKILDKIKQDILNLRRVHAGSDSMA